MPICRNCQSEYVEGAVRCAHCGTPVGDAVGSGTGQELVDIWRCQGEMEAQIVRSLLESNGIEALLSGESLRLTHGLTVDGLAEVRIIVRREDADKAADVIATIDDVIKCRHCGRPMRKTDETCPGCGADTVN